MCRTITVCLELLIWLLVSFHHCSYFAANEKQQNTDNEKSDTIFVWFDFHLRLTLSGDRGEGTDFLPTSSPPTMCIWETVTKITDQFFFLLLELDKLKEFIPPCLLAICWAIIFVINTKHIGKQFPKAETSKLASPCVL